MNLKEVVDSLEAKDIQLAIDLGVHQNCLIDSNCPRAVELRVKLQENNVGLPEILKGYQTIAASNPFNWDNTSFQIDGRIKVSIQGHEINLDLTEEIRDSVNNQMRYKLEQFKQQEEKLKKIGHGLYDSYLEEIAKQRRANVLPQLFFTQQDLIKFNIMVSAENNRYVFLSPSTYKPEYIVRDGVRYELSPTDKRTLRRAMVFKFVISRENKFVQITQLDMTGEHFQHYHSRNTDCWGQLEQPQLWGRSLEQLDRLKISFSNALVTINYNSLMQDEPPDMPNVNTVLGRATQLGKEGVIEEQPNATGTRIGTEHGTRWGRRA